ncbi:MAG: zinc ribbon domain-containing protein, partial [Methanosphaera sp.]|nr:zinc ribbon domain-containing protein [Methanosphaera sp.]
MICDNCGHINPNINKTCDNCGKKLEPAPRYPTESNKSTNRTYDENEGLFDDIKNLSTDRKIIGVCCLLLVFIFAVSSVLPYNNDTNPMPFENNSTDYVTDVNNTPEVIETPTKINTNINVTAKSPVKSGESTIIKGYLLDESDNPLSNRDVIVKISNNEFDVKTKYDGSYTLEYNDTENGSQNVSVTFEESEDYYGCTNYTFFEVVNNTTDDNNNSNNTTENNTTAHTNNDQNNTNAYHDTYNYILGKIFNNHDKDNKNLTTGNNSPNDSQTENTSVDSHNTTPSNNTTANNTKDNATDNHDNVNTTENNTHNNTQNSTNNNPDNNNTTHYSSTDN